jgi:mycoredoxin
MFRTSPRRQEITDQDAAPVVVYGTQWCAGTQMVRRYLDRMRIPYVFRDLDRDAAATNQVKWWTGGYASHPTLQIGGDILVEPTMEELKWTLAQNGLIG